MCCFCCRLELPHRELFNSVLPHQRNARVEMYAVDMGVLPKKRRNMAKQQVQTTEATEHRARELFRRREPSILDKECEEQAQSGSFTGEKNIWFPKKDRTDKLTLLTYKMEPALYARFPEGNVHYYGDQTIMIAYLCQKMLGLECPFCDQNYLASLKHELSLLKEFTLRSYYFHCAWWHNATMTQDGKEIDKPCRTIISLSREGITAKTAIHGQVMWAEDNLVTATDPETAQWQYDHAYSLAMLEITQRGEGKGKTFQVVSNYLPSRPRVPDGTVPYTELEMMKIMDSFWKRQFAKKAKPNGSNGTVHDVPMPDDDSTPDEEYQGLI